jgi:hypothetical protein
MAVQVVATESVNRSDENLWETHGEARQQLPSASLEKFYTWIRR